MLNLIGLNWDMVWYIQYSGSTWLNSVGQNSEINEQYDKDCVADRFQLAR